LWAAKEMCRTSHRMRLAKRSRINGDVNEVTKPLTSGVKGTRHISYL